MFCFFSFLPNLHSNIEFFSRLPTTPGNIVLLPTSIPDPVSNVPSRLSSLPNPVSDSAFRLSFLSKLVINVMFLPSYLHNLVRNIVFLPSSFPNPVSNSALLLPPKPCNTEFCLSSLPNLVCVLLRLCCRAPSFAVQYFCWRMSHISALLNPFLYGFLRKSLRSRIRRALNRHVPCLRSNQVEDLDPAPTTVRFNARLSSATMPRDPEASTVQLSA
ncbi:hypothetical protein BaRGS_00001214 [Batillaria attramentaria]|uniref:G-protein coupled receptors family 1 profile domain-containing protein n=1 Tax=Batillaria attramentaria TaxID=370345 RepID=A0ABD0M7C4_9CAEN